MSIFDQQRKVYNYFHGSEDLNVVSQVDLFLQGHRDYASALRRDVAIVTDTETQVSNGMSPRPANVTFSVQTLFHREKNVFYTNGVHITGRNLRAPTNTKEELASGRYLLLLARTTLKNVKKAVAMAEEWLDGGKLPSGRTWDDLYAYISSNHEANDKLGNPLMGFMAFVIFTKYSDVGENKLSSLAINDDDNRKDDEGGRMSARKKTKVSKDEERSIDAINMNSIFAQRGLTIDQRVHIVEVAQLGFPIY